MHSSDVLLAAGYHGLMSRYRACVCVSVCVSTRAESDQHVQLKLIERNVWNLLGCVCVCVMVCVCVFLLR